MKVKKAPKDKLNIELQTFKDGKKETHNLIFTVDGVGVTIRNVSSVDVDNIGWGLVNLAGKMRGTDA